MGLNTHKLDYCTSCGAEIRGNKQSVAVKKLQDLEADFKGKAGDPNVDNQEVWKKASERVSEIREVIEE